MTVDLLKAAGIPEHWNPDGVRPPIERTRRSELPRAPAWANSVMAALAVFFLPPMTLSAAESPFFITYTHQMEEPGNLEFGSKNVIGKPRGGNRFLGTAAEFEYGVKAWWTTELYLDGQSTHSESTSFTGYRWENRFRLLPKEHWINPVFYFEFANINGADRSLLEIVNHDGNDDLATANSESRHEKKREVEAKLILSSYFHGWTIAENFIAEKNIKHSPFEFGYAVGASRPLAFAARAEQCNFCPENFQVGLEMYGGLGTHENFGVGGTSHYVAPTVSWRLANDTTFKISPGFGVTGNSTGYLLRFGVSYEVAQFGRATRKLFRGGTK